VARWLFAVLTGLLSVNSAAQFAGSLALISDYRFRGVSLSDDQAAAQLDVGFDHESGWYAGVFASNVRFYADSPTRVQALAYAGYAQRLLDGVSVDAGASYSDFPGQSDYNYSEVHAGFTTDNLSGRLYFAPNYFGQELHTFYGELNGSRRLAENIRLFGHAGMLQIASGPSAGGASHFDARAGVEIAFRALRLQLSRVANQGASPAYPVSDSRINGTWTAAVSGSF